MQPSVPLPHPEGPLSGYRVLDLADEKGQLCARLLGEFGADVIKIEPREGHPTRANGPFFRDREGPDTSIYWWAMNAGKRSVTCELRLEAGRDLFRELVKTADILVETTKPGELAALGLDYPCLAEVNPGLVMVSITNFGQDGPYRDLDATDIVGSALGGHMFLNGDMEKGPVRTTAPQAYAQVNVQAGVGAMVALYARAVNDGRGQHVDVSMQEAMANAMDNTQQTWDIRHLNPIRPGVRRNAAGQYGARYLFETSDGWLTALQVGGLIGPGANTIIDWLAETGEARDLAMPAWRTKLTSLQPLSEQERDYVEETLNAFTKKRLKDDLVREAQARGAGWAPVLSPHEIVENGHLADREFWIRVQHEDLGESFVYPGPPVRMAATPWQQRGRAPRLGEHNEDVYAGLLGKAEADLRRLRARMVI
jgi:crotonobetainyl-CoA:carnitine CoA-transferase CaiB-like acyl-CoA transferase